MSTGLRPTKLPVKRYGLLASAGMPGWTGICHRWRLKSPVEKGGKSAWTHEPDISIRELSKKPGADQGVVLPLVLLLPAVVSFAYTYD